MKGTRRNFTWMHAVAIAVVILAVGEFLRQLIVTLCTNGWIFSAETCVHVFRVTLGG